MIENQIDSISVENFATSIDCEWFSEALEASGSASVRKRKFPAEHVAWLVIGMALFANKSTDEVVAHLRLVLPGKSIVRSAIPQARYRLGAEPIKLLFRKSANAWRSRLPAHKWRGLSLLGLDGSCIKVQDSDENYAHFGKATGGKSETGYPQARIACLMDLLQRMMIDAALGPYATSELELAQDLWGLIPDNSLTILDRGFNAYPVFNAVVSESNNRHLLVRLRADMKCETIRDLSDGSRLVRIVPDKAVLAASPTIRSEIIGRVVDYHHPDGKPSRLFTTLLDEKRFPAADIVELYHQRWEIELAFDELKTHLLERKECLRSKKVEGVEQELWGIFLAYNLVRFEMADAARQWSVRPNQVSFRHSLEIVRSFFIRTAWIAPPTKLTQRLAEMREQLQIFSLLTLPPRRSERRYPREVKVVTSRYRRNRRVRVRA